MRIIETRDGIQLILLTDEPMPDSLVEEISEWQLLGRNTVQSLPDQ